MALSEKTKAEMEAGRIALDNYKNTVQVIVIEQKLKRHAPNHRISCRYIAADKAAYTLVTDRRKDDLVFEMQEPISEFPSDLLIAKLMMVG